MRANYEIDFISYFVPVVHIKYLIKAYKKAKKYYFKNSKEELTIKIKEKEEMFRVLQKEIDELKEQLEKKKKKITILNRHPENEVR